MDERKQEVEQEVAYITVIACLVIGFLVVSINVILLNGKVLDGCENEFSSGSRVGTITKFSKKGWIFKSYEGEAMIGGLEPGPDGGLIPVKWSFTVLSKDLVPIVEEAMASGQKVRMDYVQVWARGVIRANSSYRLIGLHHGDEASSKKEKDAKE